MTSISFGPSTRLLVLTGAGVSAESGIPTFRDAGGLWEGHAIEDVASPEGFERDPITVWRFYSQRRRGVAQVRPNGAHAAIAEVEARLGDRFLLVTQNVDGLHIVAGSQRVIELHGNLLRTRCSRCARPAFVDHDVYEAKMPMCGQCKAAGRDALLRPDIVWFGEMIDPAALARIDAFVTAGPTTDLVFLAAGTSGLVYPAAGLVEAVSVRGGKTYLANMERPSNVASFDHVVLGPASQVLPTLLGSA
jgi:NAD-dependent deacetylase